MSVDSKVIRPRRISYYDKPQQSNRNQLRYSYKLFKQPEDRYSRSSRVNYRQTVKIDNNPINTIWNGNNKSDKLIVNPEISFGQKVKKRDYTNPNRLNNYIPSKFQDYDHYNQGIQSNKYNKIFKDSEAKVPKINLDGIHLNGNDYLHKNEIDSFGVNHNVNGNNSNFILDSRRRKLNSISGKRSSDDITNIILPKKIEKMSLAPDMYNSYGNLGLRNDLKNRLDQKNPRRKEFSEYY